LPGVIVNATSRKVDSDEEDYKLIKSLDQKFHNL
jgi:hypothetical protein